MAIFAGLDVSDKTTHVCVVADDGAIQKRDVVASDPDVLAKWLGKHCADLVRVVLETGPLSTFLYHGLTERGIPVECICARHAKGVLAARVNKSDVHDAEGLGATCPYRLVQARSYEGVSNAHRSSCAAHPRATNHNPSGDGQPAVRPPEAVRATPWGRPHTRQATRAAQRLVPAATRPRTAVCAARGIHGSHRGATSCFQPAAGKPRGRRCRLQPSDRLGRLEQIRANAFLHFRRDVQLLLDERTD